MNEWGIAELDPKLQLLDLDPAIHKVRRWGIGSRWKYNGTHLVHFYIYDAKFGVAKREPERFVQYGIANFVEPNFHTDAEMDRWRALQSIGWKRHAAKVWQENGHRIMVDLNVHDRFMDLVFLGLSPEWRSFAIRPMKAMRRNNGHVRRLDMARKHAGTKDLTFLVVGGGAQVRAWAEEEGLVYVPDPRATELSEWETQVNQGDGL